MRSWCTSIQPLSRVRSGSRTTTEKDGLSDYGTASRCTAGPDVAQDADGRWTGWLWVPPGVNSKGEAYGGCRRAFACKLNVPEQEEPFGPGGTPTEEDYECVNR